MDKQTDQNIKTIRFPITADSKLQKMAEKCGLTKIEFFIAMVDYFYKSKKDPRDLNDELLKKELVKRTDRVIAFIKVIEDNLLMPLITSTDRINNSQEQIVNYFNKHIIGHNKDQKEAYAKQQTMLNSVQTSMKHVEAAQYTKDTVKRKCLDILNFYIQHREAMGMMTKQVDKDSLIENVRQQMKNL
ncbi:MAG TPA: BfmA/BtgA family mobilization protein [Mucilaginibacter sp.]